MAAARNFKSPDADTDFSGYARRFYSEIILNTAFPAECVYRFCRDQVFSCADRASAAKETQQYRVTTTAMRLSRERGNPGNEGRAWTRKGRNMPVAFRYFR